MKTADIALECSLAFFMLVILFCLAGSFWLSAHPPPQQPYQSIQTIRIEYVQAPQPQAKGEANVKGK